MHNCKYGALRIAYYLIHIKKKTISFFRCPLTIYAEIMVMILINTRLINKNKAGSAAR